MFITVVHRHSEPPRQSLTSLHITAIITVFTMDTPTQESDQIYCRLSPVRSYCVISVIFQGSESQRIIKRRISANKCHQRDHIPQTVRQRRSQSDFFRRVPLTLPKTDSCSFSETETSISLHLMTHIRCNHTC